MCIRDSYYVFYHRHSNRKQSSRQACAERIRFENGKFYQAEMTSCGLNDGPLKGKGNYPSYISCNVYGKKGTRFLSMIKHPKSGHPYPVSYTHLCHLKPGEEQEQASIRYLYEIANVLPGFLEERGFTAESAQGVKLSTSDQPVSYTHLFSAKQSSNFL